MQTLRTIFFWVFATIYLVTAPLLILYALGYTYRTGEEGGLLETGLIAIETEPPGADVVINGRRHTGRTPAVLRDMLPGSYRLRVELEGHRSWSDTVHIEPAKAVLLKPILLLPDPLRFQTIGDRPYRRLTPLPDTRYALLWGGRTLESLEAFDLRTLKSQPLSATNLAVREASIERVFTVPGSKRVVLRARLKSKRLLLGFDLDQAPDDEPTVLQDRLPDAPERLTWDADAPRRVLARIGNDLYLIDEANTNAAQRIADDARGMGLHGRRPCWLTADGRILEADSDGGNPSPMNPFDEDTPTLPVSDEWYTLEVLDDDAVLLRTDQGDGWVLTDGRAQPLKGLRWARMNAARDRALIGLSDGLALLEPEDREADRPLVLPTDRVILKRAIDTRTTPMSGCWACSDAYALYQLGDEIRLASTRLPDRSHAETLFRACASCGWAYDDAYGRILYLDPETRRPVCVDIRPARLLSWPPRLPAREIEREIHP